jgi:formiminotetrahydrofolate cyclodeaminase
MQSLLALRSITNPNLASDLNVGIWMALAAGEGALENVAVNLKAMPHSEFVAAQNRRYQELKSLLKQFCLANL